MKKLFLVVVVLLGCAHVRTPTKPQNEWVLVTEVTFGPSTIFEGMRARLISYGCEHHGGGTVDDILFEDEVSVGDTREAIYEESVFGVFHHFQAAKRRTILARWP